MGLDMDAFGLFDISLREVMAHLHDPLYDVPEAVRAGLGLATEPSNNQVKQAIIAAIHRMEPGSGVPVDAPARRYHDLLVLRYIQALTQEAAAAEMGISPRYLRDLQWRAVRSLAKRLWKSLPARPKAEIGVGPTLPSLGEPSQMMQELASLRRSAPGLYADLRDTIKSALRLSGKLWPDRDVSLTSEIPSQLRVPIHPSALRQILIKAMEALTDAMPSGSVVIEAKDLGDRVQIALRGVPVDDDADFSLHQVREMLVVQGGAVEVHTAPPEATIQIALPPILPRQTATVLVVDDNEDLVSFFRSYVVGTPYRIAHVGQAGDVWQAISHHRPQVIVLDVMLPDADMDGWDLLLQLHEHPDTRTLPIVVCSVIRDPELAAALGAIAYLSKPVRRREFLEALDLALSRAF
jgi:CheY-like chemotaxis protein